MNYPKAPIDLDSAKTSSRQKRTSRAPAVLISVLLGGVSAVIIFFVLKQTLLYEVPDRLPQATVAGRLDDSRTMQISSEEKNDVEESASQDSSTELTSDETPVGDNSEPLSAPREVVVAVRDDPPPLSETNSLPDFPDSDEVVKDEPQPAPEKSEEKSKSQAETAQKSGKQDKEEEREGPKLSKRRWTTLVLLNPAVKGESAIPDDFPIWNFEKGYTFTGSRLDVHRLGDFRVDGEFIIRDGYLRREFGNTALLRLPEAEDFELEGIAHFEGAGGWLMLLGWDIEKKSGYAIYNTKLRVSGSMWFAIEIADGKPVANSERLLVKRDAQGEGALRVLVDQKKVSMQAAGAYLFRDEEFPNYKPGHVAIGTFSPQYGPQNIGIKSLRMKLR